MHARTALLCAVLAALAAQPGCGPAAEPAPDGSAPPEPPVAIAPLVGDYASGADTLSLLEADGVLVLARWGGERSGLRATGEGTLSADDGATVAVVRGGGEGVGVAHPVAIEVDGGRFERLSLGAEDGGTFRITPQRPIRELRAEALAATPPAEQGAFRPSDLVELVALDSTIHLDVRYASTNNFMSEVFYSQARAFLQRPAAEALVRAHRWLGERGYGLLIHDGYRPWYVTKMFWDATPEPLRVFVADPASGSRHNRGCAVDLTLYDLATGDPVVMTGGYDEMSPRSYPDYPGGTSRQRWHRDLLREAMELQGFGVYEAEWWHFDYRDWRSYRIGNDRFEELGVEAHP